MANHNVTIKTLSTIKRLHFALFRLLMALTLTATAGCSKTTGLSVTSACNVFNPITWSGKDTDATLKQIKIHNAKYVGACNK